MKEKFLTLHREVFALIHKGDILEGEFAKLRLILNLSESYRKILHKMDEFKFWVDSVNSIIEIKSQHLGIDELYPPLVKAFEALLSKIESL